MLVLKLGLFAMSTLGTLELLRLISKGQIDIHFLPSLAIAAQVTVLFFAGLLNILPETTFALYLLGFVGLTVSIRRCKGISFVKSYFTVGYAVLAFVIAVMALYVRGKIFTHYDNFSHWALVVKTMLLNDRYPTFKDSVIMFQEYPLGSSTYIYFFSRLISKGEPTQMLAQIYMLTACTLPIFTFAKKHTPAIAIVVLAFINFLFVYNIRPNDLLVDTLLPVVGICGLLFAFLYCNKDVTKIDFICSSFYMVQLVQIKNSGIFFAVIIALLILKRMRFNKRYFPSILCILFPLLSVILWHKHCRYVFQSAEWSLHALTYERMLDTASVKTFDDMRKICMAFLKFTCTYKDAWVIFGLFVITAVIIWVVNKHQFSSFKQIVLLSAILFITYQLGMLGMYIFSMSTEGALGLAGIERYTKTILIAVSYLYVLCLVQIISDMNKNQFAVLLLTAYSFFSFFAYKYISSGTVEIAVLYTPDSKERSWIEAQKSIYSIEDEKSYCTLIPSADSGYAYYLTRYIFYSPDTRGLVVESSDDMADISSDYILLYDQENNIINEWVQENYPEQYGNRVIVNWNK